MHKLISVAVPTRSRKEALIPFATSLVNTFGKSLEEFPQVTYLHDSPPIDDESMAKTDAAHNQHSRSVWLPYKSGMAELWNWSIILSPTDWVLICNDDVTFNPGWLTYLEETIASNKYLLIELFHYGAFCIHKSLILEIGWFDERLTGFGFEDNDMMLRISEAGLKDRVDTSHDFIRRVGDVEVGHFVNHHKYAYKFPGNPGEQNGPWLMHKWGRDNDVAWDMPSYRKVPEVDWHPAHTNKFAHKFGYNHIPWVARTTHSWKTNMAVYP